jgi:hypothetical protein
LFSYALFWFVFLSPFFPFPFPFPFGFGFPCALASLRLCVPFFQPSLLQTFPFEPLRSRVSFYGRIASPSVSVKRSMALAVAAV